MENNDNENTQDLPENTQCNGINFDELLNQIHDARVETGVAIRMVDRACSNMTLEV